jgi:hypothetical protein
MVTALKISRDLKSITMEELISSLKSLEIELEADKSPKKVKTEALKSNNNPEKVQALQGLCSKHVEDVELLLLSRRINQLWKHKQMRLRSFHIIGGRAESSSGQRKPITDKDVI